MTVLDKIKQKPERILLLGHTGHGKTYTATRLAVNLANKGKKVMYLDTEKGSYDEWESLSESGKISNKIDRNITLITPNDFVELKKYALEFQDKIDVIIIDPIRLNTFARDTAKKIFLEKGIRYVGEKVVPIEDKDTYHLRGFDYQLPNEWQQELFFGLTKGKCHVIVTELVPLKLLDEVKSKFAVNIDKILTETEETELPKKLKELFDFMGWFDRVVVLERQIRNGKKNYYGVIVKWRGKDLSGVKVDNVVEFLLKNTKLVR